ncbi:uncharacterized protein ASCRUDRAFT_5694 [Ascoidea rubescens DSM 1968]|uniref:Uncharacterized protein n=1 Tax=Ascoidea rubescens DSM 1968 TaxID=1344418 RepID=A0A1D2VQC1_9ASCO|nr:hypothetical protein ASCRUDRAFT_5694 [Ascoidea rubescens DSM 1968]ODV63755.1 hypothetical protein ASCRUDRAFT_5694 [Ascoidea rubescens DSM 1968]
MPFDAADESRYHLIFVPDLPKYLGAAPMLSNNNDQLTDLKLNDKLKNGVDDNE